MIGATAIVMTSTSNSLKRFTLVTATLSISSTTSTMATGKEWTQRTRSQDYSVYRRGPDLKIILTRPRKGNVLTPNVLRDLTALYQEAAKDRTIFRIILTAEGKYFCTGMDLGAEGGVLDDDQAAKQRQWKATQDLFESIDRSPQVTIAVINGPAYGAGIGLAFTCDIRIATEGATLNVSEAKVGIAPAVIMKWVIREWGIGRGREAMLTARPVKPAELVGIGAVHSVTKDASELDIAADQYIRYLDACGPEALTAIKTITLAPETERETMIKATYDKMMAPTEEARHGVESFHEKKTPDWQAFHLSRSKL